MFNFNLSLAAKGIARTAKTYFNISKILKKNTITSTAYKGESYYYFLILLTIVSGNLNFNISVMGYSFSFQITKN